MFVLSVFKLNATCSDFMLFNARFYVDIFFGGPVSYNEPHILPVLHSSSLGQAGREGRERRSRKTRRDGELLLFPILPE